MCGCIRACGRCLCGCAIGIMQLIIFAFNIFFWVTGAVMIGIGIYLLVDGPANDYDAILDGLNDDMWITAVCTILSVGVLMFITAFLGCCGSCKNNTTMLCWYAVFMTFVLLAQCTIGIYISIQVSEADDYLGENLEIQVKEDYNGTKGDPMTDAWDSLQRNLECCGSEGHADYKDSQYYSSTGNVVPRSCCKEEADINDNAYRLCKNESISGEIDPDFLYSEGCYSKMSDWIDDYATVIYIVIYIIAAVEVACILIGFCTCCSIKRQQKG